MAITVDSLQIEIGASSASASNEIQKTTETLKGLKRATEQQFRNPLKDMARADTLSKQLESVNREIDRTAQHLKSLEQAKIKFAGDPEGLKQVQDNINTYNALMGRLQQQRGDITAGIVLNQVGDAAQTSAPKISMFRKEWERLKSQLSASARIKPFTGIQNFVRSLGRIAYYRAIRAAIKAVTKTITEGAENAYWYAKKYGESTKYIAEAYDNLSSRSYTMGNQLGAAWATLKATIQPILLSIISLIQRAADAITQFFALLGGRSTYLKAIDYTKEWGKQTAGGAKAAKEWKNQLMGFDEINRLDEPNDSGGGGGGGTPDYSKMFEEAKLADWTKKLQDLIGKLKISFDDVFLEWHNLNPEQIGKKIVTGLCGVLGMITGFVFGGVPGAITGTIAGVGVGLLISSLVFDNDGTISKEEVASLIKTALMGLCGGAIGFTIGGFKGALLGASLGISLSALLKSVEFFKDSNIDIESKVLDALTALSGAAIGWKIGGVTGALLGAAIGFSINALLQDVIFADRTGWTATDWITNLASVLAPTAGALIGFAVGGVAGAAIGLAIGFALSLAIENWDEIKAWVVDKWDQAKEWCVEKWDDLKTSVSEKVNKTAEDVKTWFGELPGRIAYWLGYAFGAAVKWWEETDPKIQAAFDSVVQWFKDLPGRIVEAVKELPGKIKEKIEEWKKVFDDNVPQMIQDVVDEFGKLKEKIKEKAHDVVQGLKDGIKEKWDELITKITEWKNEFVQGFKDAFGIHSPSTVMKELGENLIGGFWDGIKEKWAEFKLWIEEALGNFKEWWSNFSFGNLKLKIPRIVTGSRPAESAVARFFGINNIPTIRVEWDEFAKGGFPEDGLFLANHGEMVGKFSNGKTAVANNEQIIEGIKRGVYAATTEAAISGNSNSGNNERPIDIYLDGKIIARSTTRYQTQFAKAGGI